MTTTATHPMTTGGRREYLTASLIETAAFLVLAAALVICNTITDATDNVATFVLNAALVAGLLAIVGVAVAVVLRRRSWQWVVGAGTRDRAPEPGWLYWGTYGIQTAAILAVCAALVAWVRYPGLFTLDAALFYAGTGAAAAGIGFRSGRGRISGILTAVISGVVGAILGAQVGGIGTASVVTAVGVGAMLSFGVRLVRRGGLS